MKKHNRLTAFLMASVISVGAVPEYAGMNASAEDAPAVQLDGTNQLAASDDALGSVLASAINDQQVSESSGFVVYNAEMNGLDAEVTLDTQLDCQIAVCVYSDPSGGNTPKLLGSGIQNVTAGTKTAVVPVQIKELPEYYLLRAYLVGTNQVPLSKEFSNVMHTLEIQQLLASDVSDYADYEVLNLDDDMTTNFAVYNRNVHVIHYDGKNNLVTSASPETNQYQITNYNGPKDANAIVSIENADGSTTVFRIKTVTVQGTAATIQSGTALESEEVFDYIKIDTDSSQDTLTYEPPTDDSLDISYEIGSAQPAQGRPSQIGVMAEEETENDKKVYSDQMSLKLTLGKDIEGSGKYDSGGFEISGGVDFGFDYYVSYYSSQGLSMLEFEMNIDVSFSVEFSAAIELKIPLGTAVSFNPCNRIKLQLGPYFKAAVKGSVAITGTFKNHYSNDSDMEPTVCVQSLSVTAEGFIGFGIGGEMTVFDHEGELSIEAGINVSLERAEPHEGCNNCCTGTIMAEFVGTVKLDFIVDFQKELKADHQRGGFYCSDTLGFGWGTCPNLDQEPVTEPPEIHTDPDDPQKVKKDFPFITKYLQAYYPTYLDRYGFDSNEYWEQFKQQIEHWPIEIRKYDQRQINLWFQWCPVSIYNQVQPASEEHVMDYSVLHSRFEDKTFLSSSLVTVDSDGMISVTIPDVDRDGNPIVMVDSDCFAGMKNLKEVKLGKYCVFINPYAFDGCSNLETVQLSPYTRFIGTHAFYNSGLKEIRMPDTVTEIGDYAFKDCENLTICTLPSNLKRIGKDAFGGCRFGNDISSFPANLEEIGDSAFSGCNLSVSGLPAHIKRIGNQALVGLSFPDNTLYLPGTLEYLGKRILGKNSTVEKVVFAPAMYCSYDKLDSIFEIRWVPDDGKYRRDYRIIDVGQGVFSDCANLKEVILPDNMLIIPNEMFSSCYKLEKVTLPAHLVEIGRLAFWSCTSLTDIQYPSSLRKIGERAFADCKNYADSDEVEKIFALPEGLQEIGEYAFDHCYRVDPDTNYRIAATRVIPSTVERMYFNSILGTYYNYKFLNPDTEFIDDPDAFQMEYDNMGKMNCVGTIYVQKGGSVYNFIKDEKHPLKWVDSSVSKTPIVIAVKPPSDEPLTMTFENLKPDTVYNFYDLLGEEFTAENLLYLSQGVSDANGTLVVWYRPKSDDTKAKKFVACDDGSTVTTTTTSSKPEGFCPGDVNCDNSIDVSDVVLLARLLAEDSSAWVTGQGLENSDVNADGNLQSDDIIMILRYIARIITEFPASKT